MENTETISTIGMSYIIGELSERVVLWANVRVE